ncbi:MAG: hypothetical protein JW904_02825 [Spirochaetales bacterium]|nr:hypothetical protein [Spirochaetales bacterium]
MRSKDVLLLCIILCGVLLPLFSEESAGKKDIHGDLQNVSIKRELSLLTFSNNGFDIPGDITAGLNAEINKTFVSATRLSVRHTQTEMSGKDIDIFLNFISAYNKGSALPDTLQLSDSAIQKEQFIEIVKAEIIVIPVISRFLEENEVRDGQERFKLSVQTDFYFLISREARILSVKKIETLGYDLDRDQAISDAMLNIPPLLAYEIGQIKELSTGMIILGVSFDEVIIELGSNAGVAVGDEFVIQTSQTQPNGMVVTRDKAFILITEVTGEVALGIIRYAEEEIKVGDSVQNLGRFGLELSPYGFAFIPLTAGDELTVYSGIRLVLSKFVSTLRPFIAAEFVVYPFSVYEDWLPLRFFAGVEIRLFFGAFEFAAFPAVGIEQRIALSPANESEFAGVGFHSAAELSLMISRELKVFISGGYEYWIGGRQGILAGGGLSIKF